jgi:hypothetical protein
MSHRHVPTRNRNALLWALLSFILLQLGTALWIEFRSWRLRDPEYHTLATGFRKRLRVKPAEAKRIVMVGSSRTHNGLCAELLERDVEASLAVPTVAYNFGTPGGGTLRSWATVHRLLDEGPRPDYLIIEITPLLLRDEQGLPADVQYLAIDRFSYRELRVLQDLGLPVQSYRRGVRAGWALPWHSYRLNVLNELAPSWLPVGNRWNKRKNHHGGWDPLWPEGITHAARAHALSVTEAEQRGKLQTLEPGVAAVGLLRNTFERCASEQIPIMIVLMPEGATYRSFYGPGCWGRVVALARQLSQEYGAPLANARRWVEEDQFVDSTHLMAPGAIAFTERLTREAVIPWITQSLAASCLEARAKR